MDKAEFERIKEAEKAHLRSLKQLKEAVRHLERQRNVSQALENMTSGARQTIDEQAELVERLAMETAQNEARLDVALSAAEENEAAAQAAAERADEEMQQIRAQELVRQMKLQMGVPEPDAPARRPGPASEKKPEAPAPPPASGDGPPPPEKTIGRMR